jgi:hypothetical protein
LQPEIGQGFHRHYTPRHARLDGRGYGKGWIFLGC